MRYYGWYSNLSRGEREKREQAVAVTDQPDMPAAVNIIDVSEHRPKNIPSPQWRECTLRAFASRHIKKVWEVDPLECPKCGSEMMIISFITDVKVIRKILEHLHLWEEEEKIRPPPARSQTYPVRTYEPFDDGWPCYEEPYTPELRKNRCNL